MNTSGILVLLTSEDVLRSSRPLGAENAILSNFALPSDLDKTASLIQYVDGDGNTRILKNRWGRKGMVQA